ETAEKLEIMFQLVSDSFDKYKHLISEGRTNFFGYGYVLYKLVELLEDPILGHLYLFKGKEKMSACDRAWIAICTDNRWKFVPTV
ncbi:MAG: hypothetical protein MUO21_05465, partial [Nitrososphaeraceae archaeon]|nr:hypothetical protein [Nitrososphaeraceae archaeon]